MDVLAADHPEARRIIEGPLKRKMRHRLGQMRNTMKNVGLREVRTKSGVYLGRQPVFDVDGERINRVLRNVVKGVFYKTTGKPVNPTTEILIWNHDVLENQAFSSLFIGRDTWNGFGDDTFLCQVVTDTNFKDVMVCKMCFYRRFLFVGQTIPEDVRRAVTSAEKLGSSTSLASH